MSRMENLRHVDLNIINDFYFVHVYNSFYIKLLVLCVYLSRRSAVNTHSILLSMFSMSPFIRQIKSFLSAIPETEQFISWRNVIPQQTTWEKQMSM